MKNHFATAPSRNLSPTRLFRRSRSLFSALLLTASLPAFADTPLPLQFENLSGNSSSQMWIQFLGGQQITGTYTDAILGAGQQLQANTAYSLDQISDVSISSFSGRVYVSYGAYGLQGMGSPGGSYTPSAANPMDINYNTRYQYMEPTIQQAADGSSTVYADLSYIDFTAISFSMSARNSNGTLNTTVSNYNQVSSNTQALVNTTVASANSASQAILPSGASQTLPNNQFTRVISPQFSSTTTYHDFTNYLGYLDTYSFTTPAATGTPTAGPTPYPAPATTSVVLNGTFVGTGSQPSGAPNTQAQTYNFAGAFGADGSITLTALADSGNSNVSWIANGGPSQPGVGADVQITIAPGALNMQDGIYGNNVGYTVTVGGVSTVYTAITNDVYGRVVGDLLAGLSFGYVGSTVDFNGTPLGQMPSSAWWAAGEAQGTAPVYLADGTQITWAETPASQGIYFAGAQPDNDDYYNGYAANLAAIDPSTGNPYTTGYGFPLQDRLGNNLLSYNTGVTPDTYLLLTVNPDGTDPVATGKWTAGSGNWSTASNWAGNAVPTAGSTVQFVGPSFSGNYSVDTGSDQSVGGLYFNYASGSFTINNNTITLSGNVVNSSGNHNTQTINSDIAMATDGSIVAAFGNLVFGGDIALSSSTTNTANTLTFTGNYDTTVNGVISDGVTSGGSVVIATTNNDNGAPGIVTLNSANTFTGGLTLQQGTLVLGNDAALGTGTFTLGNLNPAVTVPATTPVPAVLQATGGPRTIANEVTLAGDATISGSNSFTFTGDVTIANIPANPSATPATTPQPGSPTLTNTVAVEFSGAIGDPTPPGLSGSSFTKAGSADMTFSGTTANTFSGLLSVNEGKLILNKSPNVAAYGGDLTIGIGSTTTTATVQLNADGQTNPTGAITINTDGTLDVGTYSASTQSISMAGGSITASVATPGTISIADGGSDPTFTFNGVNSASATVAANLALAGSQNFNIANTSAATEVTVTGDVTGSSISLTKAGSGSLALLGTNSLSGSSITITGGLLETTSLAGVSVAVNGGTLATSTSGGLAAQSLSLANLTSNATGAFLMALGSGTGSGNSDSITATTSVGLSETTTFLFRSDQLAGSGTGTFTLISGTGLNGFDTSSLQFASIDIAGLTGSFSISGNDLVFTAQSGVTNTWTGATSGAWTTGSNWTGPTPGATPAPGADIVFTGSSNTSVSTSQDQTTGAITFDSGASAFTISSSASNTITLGGNLTNNSTATQTFDSSVSIALNADRTISAAAGDITISGGVALSNGSIANTLTVTGSDDVTIGGLITDNNTGSDIVMDGTGVLSLTYLNPTTEANFSGTFTMKSGTVAISDPTSLGNQSASNTLIFAAPTASPAPILRVDETMTFAQGRSINLLSDGTIDTNGNDLTVEGVIYGAGGLTKAGAGSLTLNPALGGSFNSYSGQTTVAQGSLIITLSGGLSEASSGILVQDGGSLVLDGNFTFDAPLLQLNGAGDGGNGALHLSSGQSTWNGDITLQTNSTIQADTNTTLTLGQELDTGTSGLTLNAVDSGIINVAGSLTGSGEISVTGGGVVNVTGSNASFTGDTTISDGTLSITQGDSLGAGAGQLTVTSGAGSNGMLEFSGTNASTITFSSISIAGQGISAATGAIYNDSATTNTLVGDITLSADATIASALGQLIVTGDIDTGAFDLTLSNLAAQMTLSGDISGSGGLTTAGTSSFLLSGDNTYSGGTSIINGTSITAASSTALGATTGSTTVAGGGALQFQGGISIGAEALSVGGAGINGTGALNNLSGNNSYAGDITLTNTTTIQATAGKLTLSGTLTGSAPLNIQGNGEVYISGDASAFGTSGAPNLVNINSGVFASGDMVNAEINIGTGDQGDFITPTYSPGDIDNIQNVSVKGISFTGSTSIIADLGAAGNGDTITTSQATAITTPIQFFFNDAGFATGGAYTLIQNGGTGNFNIDISGLTFKSNIANLAGTFSGDNTASLIFTASAGSAVYDAAGSGQWTTSANWNIGTPAGGSAVSFNVTSAATVDTAADQYAGGIEFASGSAAVEIANNTVTTYGDIVNNSSVTQTITSDLAIDGDLSINAASADLSLGSITLSANAEQHTVTFTGSHDTTVTGTISNGTATSAAVIKAGTGTTTWSGASSFTGTTTITGGTLVIDSATAKGNTIVVENGGTVTGDGAIAGKVILDGGTVSPGNSPGIFTTGDQQWLEGSNYVWQIYDASGVAGTGYDTISITGTLDLASLTAGDFTIDIQSLSSISTAGNAINFNAASTYAWTLASTTEGITGFDATDFVLNASAFTNPTPGGEFTISVNGDDLVLNYAPIPEPSTYALLGLATFFLAFALRRRATKKLS